MTKFKTYGIPIPDPSKLLDQLNELALFEGISIGEILTDCVKKGFLIKQILKNPKASIWLREGNDEERLFEETPRSNIRILKRPPEKK